MGYVDGKVAVALLCSHSNGKPPHYYAMCGGAPKTLCNETSSAGDLQRINKSILWNGRHCESGDIHA